MITPAIAGDRVQRTVICTGSSVVGFAAHTSPKWSALAVGLLVTFQVWSEPWLAAMSLASSWIWVFSKASEIVFLLPPRPSWAAR